MLDRMSATMTAYSEEEDPSLIMPSWITYRGVKYPILSSQEFERWIDNGVGSSAAFPIDGLNKRYSLIKFHESDFTKYSRLSNLARTPFIYPGLRVESVESLIYANIAQDLMPFSETYEAIAKLDGYSARNVGKHFKAELVPREMRLLVDSKLNAYPELRKLAFEAIEEGNFLVCTDRTPFDNRAIDLIWGMVEHKGYLIGQNLLGKIYHELYEEDMVIRSHA